MSESSKSLRDELQRLADEVRLKVHLGSMEVKDAWAKLEPKLFDFEQRAASTTHDVASELKELGSDLKAQLERLRDNVRS